MKQVRSTSDRNDDRIDCFSHFRMHNRICREFCALRLRCLIERNQMAQPDFFDEDISIFDEVPLMSQ